MDPIKLAELIEEIGKTCNLDPNLALAIAFVESGIDHSKVRYEPRWDYLVNPPKYAKQLGITRDTEHTLQMFSWGPMQVMGSNARALGYSGMLTLLVEPNQGILYACKHLQTLQKKFPQEQDLISAYNQGVPAKLENGLYRNQQYVSKVMDRLKFLRKE